MANSGPTIGIRWAGNNVRHGFGGHLLDANLPEVREHELNHDRIFLADLAVLVIGALGLDRDEEAFILVGQSEGGGQGVVGLQVAPGRALDGPVLVELGAELECQSSRVSNSSVLKSSDRKT